MLLSKLLLLALGATTSARSIGEAHLRRSQGNDLTTRGAIAASQPPSPADSSVTGDTPKPKPKGHAEGHFPSGRPFPEGVPRDARTQYVRLPLSSILTIFQLLIPKKGDSIYEPDGGESWCRAHIYACFKGNPNGDPYKKGPGNGTGAGGSGSGGNGGRRGSGSTGVG